MPAFLHILARNDSPEGVIIFIIIAVLWVLGHLASFLKKASSPAKPRTVPKPPPVPTSVRLQIPAMKQALRSAPPMARPVKTPPARIKQQRTAVFSARPVPPPLPAARVPQPAPAPRKPAPAPAPEPVATSAQATRRPAFASSINRWLQPNTLRKQFILTEIFQPPLALRDERMKSEI